MSETLRLSLGDGSNVLIVVGDITQPDSDAIVNAANSSLMGGGGVDGAIHRAGGPAILDECKKIVAERGRLPAGEAVSTTGGKLRAGYVIHTVGPVWQGGANGEAEVLARCYRNSIALADKLHLVSMSFPAISTGAFGYPAEEATKVAFATTLNALKNTKRLREVRFVLFDRAMFEIYTRRAEALVREHTNASYRLDRI